MPDKETLERAREDKREGKSPSTQAGEFVREEMDHIREGKHGARSTKQAIAIGLSKARRAGVRLPAPEKGSVSQETRAARAATRGAHARASRRDPLGPVREPLRRRFAARDTPRRAARRWRARRVRAPASEPRRTDRARPGRRRARASATR